MKHTYRRLRHHLTGWRALLLLTVFIGATLAFEHPSGAATQPSCRNMTDSITRLYTAYLNRAPDPAGLEYWVGRYRSGAGLETISTAIGQSPESQDPGGTHDFVDWMYRTLTPGTVPKFDTWTSLIDNGYPRGKAVLTFTESEEYVTRTKTAKPLAGYYRWYPAGTTWNCGSGPRTFQTGQLDSNIHVDYLLDNHGTNNDPVAIWTERTKGKPWIKMTGETLKPGYHDYQWDGTFKGSGNYGTYLGVQASNQTVWVIVLVPGGIGEERLGW